MEYDKFRFTGVDVCKDKDGNIQVSMEAYAKSIEKIPVFRKGDNASPVTEVERKLYRKYVGKLLWLSENVRPDLAYTALDMSRKATKATLKDLKAINGVVDLIHSRENRIVIKRVGEKEDLIIKSLCDASFFTQEPSVMGEIILLGNKKTNAVAPLYWKSKSITRTCESSKAAETRACGTCVGDSVYSAERIEKMLHGESKKRIKVELHTDSEPLIESIKSTKRVEDKSLSNVMEKLKEEMMLENVSQYSYISTRDNAADILTKRKTETQDFYGLFLYGIFDKASMRKMVKLVKREHTWEIRMFEHGEDRDGSMTVPVTNQEANLVDVKSKSRFEESGGE